MKIAIIFASQTGNTAAVARAIREGCAGHEIVAFGPPPAEVGEAELIFAGSWTDRGTCAQEVGEFLRTLHGKTVALFGTAGFGLASGNLYYFFGALYLYFINTVFISLATFLVVRLLKYPKKVFLDKQREKIVTRYVGLIVFFTIVPSLFLSYNLIRSSYFENRVQTFIAEELNFPDTQILSKRVTDTSEEKAVEVVLIGQTVPDASIANARAKMPKYGLKDVRLVVRQGFGQEATDINELKSLLMRDLYKNSEEVLREQTIQLDSLRRRVNAYQSSERLTAELLPEMRVLFPSVVEASCSNTYILRTDTARADTVLLVYLRSETPLREEERKKIKRWLSARVEMENIKLLIE